MVSLEELTVVLLVSPVVFLSTPASLISYITIRMSVERELHVCKRLSKISL